jgi:SNF2 family DNA or RNA helicase
VLSKPRFVKGDNVQIISTGKIGTINRVIKGTTSYSYKLTVDGETRIYSENYLELHKDEEEIIFEDFHKANFGDYNDFELFQTWYRLARPLDSNLYSYLSSKTIFNPHQFKPLIKFLSQNSYERLYLADEVGVGKTIESGIILKELFARDQLDQTTPILVVCPNSLGPKWQKELKERFNLDFHIHDGESLKLTLQTTIDEGIFPPRYIHSIVSIQLLRHQNYLPLLKELESNRFLPVFQIVIVDEAHHMRNQETDSNEVGMLLSSITQRMLMLSATPLNLRSEDLYNQMNILNPELFPDISVFNTLQNPCRKINRLRILLAGNLHENGEAISNVISELESDPIGNVISNHPIFDFIDEKIQNTKKLNPAENVKLQTTLASLSPLYNSFNRTRKREALKHQVSRDAWHVPVRLTKPELEFIEEFIDAVKKDYLRKGGKPVALGFITNIFRRMTSSCIPAMKDYLERAIKTNKTIEVSESDLFWEYEDDTEFKEQELSGQLRNDFIKLLEKLNNIKEDSKYNQFKKLLDKIMSDKNISQVIIFSFFIRTLEYLKQRLIEDGYKVGIIHGEITLTGDSNTLGRYEIMDKFQKGDYDLLLSSEVGGEGLDFQFCRAIINYDLPYNPMRIEQRIGRIDRFGQQADKIIIANLFIQDTVDEEIYERLYKRIRIVEDGVGALEPIIGKQISDIQNRLLNAELSEEEKEELSERIEESVEYAKSQMEAFERHRRELLNDGFIDNPLNQYSKSTFISPEDAINLTEKALSFWENCSFRKFKENRGVLTLSPDLKIELEQFLRNPKNYSGYSELRRILSDEKRFKVIFDGATAIKYPDHIFLPPTGYWTRFLTSWLNRNGHIKKIFKFSIKPKAIDLPSGEYIVFIFELKIEGLKTEIELVGIPIEVPTKRIPIYEKDIVRDLSNLSVENYSRTKQVLDIYEYLDLAREKITQLIETRKQEIVEQNDYIIEGRIAALKKSSKSHVDNLQKRIETHIMKRQSEGLEPNDLYMRLTTARIENEEEKLQKKIEELQKKSDISFDYKMESVILLEILEA